MFQNPFKQNYNIVKQFAKLTKNVMRLIIND